MTDKEKKKNVIRDFVSQKKEIQGMALLKERKKDIFRDLVSKKKRRKKKTFLGTWSLRKKRKDTCVNPCLAGGKK